MRRFHEGYQMSNTNTGGPVFPTEVIDHEGIRHRSEGMTLRDYFAAKAMQGLLAQSQGTAIGSRVEIAAEYAYAMADAMLKARET
jgi:hypothetical protein